MFSDYSRGNRIAARSVLTLAWLFVALGSIGANFVTPITIESEIGTILSYVWANIAALGALFAALGTILNLYRVEWVAAWFTAAGLALYCGTVWWLFLAGAPTRLTQASYITAFLLFVVLRGIMGGALAAKLRAASNVRTGVIDVVD